MVYAFEQPIFNRLKYTSIENIRVVSLEVFYLNFIFYFSLAIFNSILNNI